MRTGFHIDPCYANHVTPAAHPERPDRIQHLLGLVRPSSERGVEIVTTERRATREELLRVHTEAHVDRIAATKGEFISMLDPDTYASADSYETALRAAGGMLEVVDAVMSGALDNGFAAVRPPGHHAESDHAMGFCLFNNIAVAARHLLDVHGLERVLILDYDVHHCNATQHSFYGEPRVLVESIHQYPFYPGTGRIDDTGEGDGAGATVNVPCPGGFGDAEYLAAFERVIIPVAREFAPQFVLLSAGFDAHRDDPLGGMLVTEAGFDAMTAMALEVARASANGRFAAVLEGGYDLHALRACVDAVLSRMHGDAGEAMAAPGGATAADGLLEKVREIQSAHWSL